MQFLAGPQLEPLSEALASHSFEEARNEAANCLGVLMKMIGERLLNSIMDQQAEVRKVKVLKTPTSLQLV